MTYHMEPILSAVHGRLAGDVALGGLFNEGNELVGGVYNTRAKALEDLDQRPHVVYRLAADRQDDQFRGRSRKVLIAVHVFIAAARPSGVDAIDRLNRVVERLIGPFLDGEDEPAYGLDRWAPDLSEAGWFANPFLHVDTTMLDAEGVYELVATFEVDVSYTGEFPGS